jgi:hypothetical protein
MTLHRKTARPMTQAQSSRDLENTQVQNLATAVPTLLERAAAAPAGRAPLTLVLGTGAALKPTLLALRGGVRLAEHDTSGQRRSRSSRAGCGWWRARRAGCWVRATTCGSRRLGIGWRAWGTLPPS